MKHSILISIFVLCSTVFIGCETNTKHRLRDNPEFGNPPRLKVIADLKEKYKNSGVTTSLIFLGFRLGMSHDEYRDHLNQLRFNESLVPIEVEIRDTLPNADFEKSVAYRYIFRVLGDDNVSFINFNLVCHLDPKFLNDRLCELSIGFWGLGSPVVEGNHFVEGRLKLIPWTIPSDFTKIWSTYNVKYYVTYGLWNDDEQIDKFIWIINNLEIRLTMENRSLFIHSINYLNGFNLVYRDYFVYDKFKDVILQNAAEERLLKKKQDDLNKNLQEEQNLKNAKKMLNDI